MAPKKKDFSNVNTEAIYNVISEATEETAAANEKEPKRRVNMEFKQSNYDYLKTMAGINEQTVTEYLNGLVEKNMKDNEDLYNKIKAFKQTL